MIDLEFLTTDLDTIDLCKRYWRIDRNGNFGESTKTLLSFGAFSRLPFLEIFVSRHVVARDTRQRCPVCGMPKPLGTRANALHPLAPRQPCADCRYLKRSACSAHGYRASPLSNVGNADGFNIPARSMILLDALRQAVGPALQSGFSAHECTGLAASHIGRFLEKLREDGAIEEVADPEGGRSMGTNTFRLANAAAFERYCTTFRQLNGQGVIEPHSLWEIWLDYGVAECMRFICDQSQMHGLPIDPEHEALCAVLRSAIAEFTISQTWAMSLTAVHAASMLVAKGSSVEDALSSLHGHIDRQCKAHYFDLPVAGPMPRPPAQPRAILGDWFHTWFGIDEHTLGNEAIASLSDQPGAKQEVSLPTT